MQRLSFSWSFARHFPGSRDWGRMWALLCLLPLLWMSVASPGLHSHEERAASAFRASRPERGAPLPHFAPHRHETSNHQTPAPVLHGLALTWGGEHEATCWLCQWASVAGACLMVALALSLAWPPLGSLSRPANSALFPLFVPLSLRSRAPPL